MRLTSEDDNDIGPGKAGLNLFLAVEPDLFGGSLAVGEVCGLRFALVTALFSFSSKDWG